MKRNWNWRLWTGFLFALAGLVSFWFFAQFPITRDFPWANLLLFAIGGFFLFAGVVRAVREPQVYRGKIFGPILATLSVIVFALFAYGMFYVVRQMPPSKGAPRVGDKAPDFTLTAQNGIPITLSHLESSHGTRSVLLIFYRGHW
jgi:hypothetical protein